MKLLSSEERKPRVRTLQDWFDIQTLGLTLQTLNGKFHVQSSVNQRPIGQFAPEADLFPGVVERGTSLVEAWRVILLPDETEGHLPRRPKKVSVGPGANRFFKSTYCSEQADCEILALVQIRFWGLLDVVRISIIYELVYGQGDYTSTSISGILLKYIEHYSRYRYRCYFSAYSGRSAPKYDATATCRRDPLG